MKPEFELNDEALGSGRHVIAVRGEVDLFTAPELKRRLVEVADSGSTRMVIDLSETTLVDSTALGVLIGAAKRLRALDGELAIVNRDEIIASTFEITGLDQIFTIRATRDEAVAALDESAGSVA
jgi:anti-sigma B factor antagonist